MLTAFQFIYCQYINMLTMYKLLKGCVAQQFRKACGNYLEYVFKASGRLLFTLFVINQCLRLMFYYEKLVFKASGRMLFSLFIIDQCCAPRIRSLRILQNFRERMLFKLFFSLFSKLYKASANGCILVYSSNFVEFPLTTAFDLT